MTLDDRLAAINGKWKMTRLDDKLVGYVEPVDNIGLHILSWPLVATEDELAKLVDEVERLRLMKVR